MKTIIIVIFGLLLNSLSTIAQNTFEFWLEYPVRKWTANAVEDDHGNFIAIVSEMTGVEYSPSDATCAYLLKISSNGDTLTKHYQYGDTLFNFTNITKTNNGGYLIAGYSEVPNTNELYLLLMEVDTALNPIWVKHHDLSGYFTVGIRRCFPMENGYILSGFVCYWPCAGLYPYFVRIDDKGNILHSFKYQDDALGEFEYLLTKDSMQIWLFTSGNLNPINGPSRAVFDTSFNHLYSESLPGTSMHMFTVLWQSDSTFLLSFNGQRPGVPYQDDELFINSYDTLLNTLHSNYFGAPDTNDYPAWVRSIDFINPDSIFFAGWKNNEIGYPSPNYITWIMTGQVDAVLQPRYLHFIGGDADYEINYILAAKDGGSLICANRFDYENVVYDLLFLKLNSEGLLVGNKPPGILLKRALVWPNPVTDRLYVQTALRDAKLIIYHTDGSPVSLHHLSSFVEEIDVTHFVPGLYIYTIITPDGYSENGKIIKKY
jgi:hypothetical protein